MSFGKLLTASKMYSPDMKATTIVFALLGTLLLWGGCEDQSASGPFASAQQAMDAGEFAAAFEQFDQILTDDPSNLAAAGQAGVCAYHLGHFSDAILYLGEAMSAKAFDEDYRWFRAMAFLRSGDLKMGESKLIRLSRFNPDRIEVWEELAEIELRRWEWRTFVEYVWECEKRESAQPKSEVLLGLKRGWMGKDSTTEGRWEMLAELAETYPEDTTLAYGEAQLRLATGQPELALACLERLTALGGQDAPLMRARALGQQGKRAEARQLLDAQEELTEQAVLVRTELLLQEDRLYAARDTFQTLSKELPRAFFKNPEIETLDLLLDFMFLGPDSISIFIGDPTPFNGGTLALKKYQNRIARGDLEEDWEEDWALLLRKAPFHPLVHYFFARTQLDQGQTEAACTTLQKAEDLGLSARYGPALARKFNSYCP